MIQIKFIDYQCFHMRLLKCCLPARQRDGTPNCGLYGELSVRLIVVFCSAPNSVPRVGFDGEYSLRSSYCAAGRHPELRVLHADRGVQVRPGVQVQPPLQGLSPLLSHRKCSAKVNSRMIRQLIVYHKYSVSPSIRPICTRCCLTMTSMIQTCSNFIEAEHCSYILVRTRFYMNCVSI